MEIKLNREELVNALQIVNLAVDTNVKLPILGNILLEINKSKLTMTATDLDVFIRHTISINSDDNLRFTAPAKRLKDIVFSLPDAEITLNAKKMLNITANNARFTLNTIPADDFPKVEIADTEKTIVMQQQALRNLLAKTIFAVSKDESRHIITGICFEFKDKRLTLAGTDGRRLAVASHDVDMEMDEMRCILPSKGLKNLLHVLQKEGEVKICLDKSLVGFEAGNTIIGIRLIEGTYPDYSKVIPNESKMEFNLDVQNLMSATKRVSIIAKDGANYSFKDGKLTITACVPEIGEAKEELEVEGSEEITIAFNAQYVLDALQNIDAEKIIFGLNTDTSPAVIEPLNDGNYVQLIMPMQAT